MKRRIYAAPSGVMSVAKRARTVSKRGKRVRTGPSRPVKAASFLSPSTTTAGASKFRTKLIYFEKGLTLNPPVAGACAAIIWNLNGLFDVETALGGHQPAGFDQLMAIYEEYQVLAVKYKVFFNNTVGTDKLIHGVTVTDSALSQSDARIYIENGNTQWTCTTGVTETGPSTSSFSGELYLADIHGMTNRQYLAATDFRGTASANPTDGAFLHMWAADIAAADPGVVSISAELEFDVIFMGTKLNAIS